jgi:hypothetical protein
MTPTLHNMATIAYKSKISEKAFSYWSEAFQLAMETKNAQAIFSVGRDFGYVIGMSGNEEQGRQLLSLAIQAGKKAGFPDVDKIEARLLQLDAPPDT